LNISTSVSQGPSLPAAIALLESARLPTEDLSAAHVEHFFFAGPADAPTGLVGLEIFGEVGLLRSLVVAPASRESGLGSALVNHAEEYARRHGVRVLYLLTTTAESFFAGRGYLRAARESAPESIRSTREFSGLCPASSAFMSRTL